MIAISKERVASSIIQLAFYPQTELYLVQYSQYVELFAVCLDDVTRKYPIKIFKALWNYKVINH